MKGNVVGQGGIPRQGDNVALASSVVGTTLKLRAPKGLYDGIDDTVNLANVFTTLGAKRFATGVITVSSSGIKTVSGVGFTPSLVVWFAENQAGGASYNYGIMISTQTMGFYSSSNNFTGRAMIGFSSSSSNNIQFDQNGNGNWKIESNGFSIYLSYSSASATHRWYAFE